MFILTEDQNRAIELACERYYAGYGYTCIAGPAGSGKSSVVRYIIQALGFNPLEVAYVAYTGKAAQVLKQKGNPNATTAHKLLYKAVPMPNGFFKFKPKGVLDFPYKMIVVDEISMLPKDLWELLLKHRIYVLALGDPFQLPVIYENQDNHVLDNPHIFFTEIMRQAQENEIIRLATWIREGNKLSDYHCDNQDIQIYKKSELVTGMYEWADQILCATNQTRNQLNRTLRQIKGYDEEPQQGDRVICLHNYWEFFDRNGEFPLTNGTTGKINYYYTEKQHFPNYIIDKPVEYMFAEFETDDGYIYNMAPIDYSLLKDGKTPVTSRIRYLMNKNKKVIDAPFEFDYGYAITTHKSQGSEYNKVLLFEEGFPYEKEEHARHLYTGITRAVDKLVIIANS